jgi:hypothetical protein
MLSIIQILGLVSLAMFIAAAGFPLLLAPLDWRGSVSYSWSSSFRTYLSVAATITLGTTGVCITLTLWTIPHFQLPKVMYGILGITYITAMIVAWWPIKEQPGKHSYLHAHFLGAAALAMLALATMACVVFGGTNVMSYTKAVCFVAMILAASWPLLFFSPLRRIFLAVESVIALSICLALVLLIIG